MDPDPAQPDSPPPPPPPRKIGRNAQLCSKLDPAHRPPGWLPPEVAAQCPVARAAFTCLVDKPGRSLRSIGRQLGVSHARLSVLAAAGRWSYHLNQLVDQSPESLAIAARQEARRSRAAMLASNRLAEGSVDAALADLVEVDEFGNVKLRAGRTIADVGKLAQARQTHAKTTAMLTGEDTAVRRSVAQAGAAKVIIQAGSIMPEPLPVAGRELAPAPIPLSVEHPREISVVVSPAG